MPIYVYRCECGETCEESNRIDSRHSNAPSHCGHPMAIVPQASMVSVQAEAHYVCPATGERITSRRQRAYVMQSNGLIDADDVNPGLIKAQDKRQAEDARIAKECREGLKPETQRQLAEFMQQNAIPT
jgi:hypothetical protein